MEREQMERLVEGEAVISEKIRILHDAGVSRAEIAGFLERSYQQVHNVLKRSNRLAKAINRPSPVMPDAGNRGKQSRVHRIAVGVGGTISLPPVFMAAQGISAGDVLICPEEDGGLRIMNREAASAMLRETARQRMPGEAALLDALLGSTEPHVED